MTTQTAKSPAEFKTGIVNKLHSLRDEIKTCNSPNRENMLNLVAEADVLFQNFWNEYGASID